MNVHVESFIFFVSIDLILEISTVKRFRVRGEGGGGGWQ